MVITIKKEIYNSFIGYSLKEAFGDKHSDLDIFNEKSEYIVIYNNDEIASIGRLTKCPNGVFFTWSNGSSNFSNGSDTVDLGRCMVSKKYRGGIYYDFLITYCFKFAFLNGFKFVNGSTIINRQMVDRLIVYGFSKSGNPILAIEPDGKEYQLQAYVVDLVKTKEIWSNILEECLSKFKTEGYIIIDKACI